MATPKMISQNIKLDIRIVVIANIRTPPGADTQAILNDMGPEIIFRVKDIPWIAGIESLNLSEVVPDMPSTRSH